jgi:hypothetical protein
MPPVVQAKCPGCKKILQSPAEWIGQSLRCKHCGIVVQARPKAAPAQPSEPALPAPSSRADAAPLTAVSTIVANDRNDTQRLSAPPPQEHAAFHDEQPFPDLGMAPIVQVASRYRRPRRGRWFMLAVGFCALIAIASLAYFFWQPLSRVGLALRDAVVGASEDADAKKTNADVPAGVEGAFPRRALVICVNNYLYANPVAYGIQGHNVHVLMDRLRNVLHIDPSQVVELSDAAQSSQSAKAAAQPGEKAAKGKAPSTAADSPARPPVKAVIEKTITEFLGGCRAQDHILLFFLGHIVESEGEAYLVPIEGDFKVKESLIPLKWLYERLKQCKARQKVLVVDTCRLDPARGVERPGSGPMSEKLDAMLAKPPDGVQVWTACTAKEYSYELDGNSVFLEKLYESLNQKVIGKIQHAPDSLPVTVLAEAVAKGTDAEAASQLKAKQTPRLAGREAEAGAAYDKQEPLPARVEIPKAPPLEGGMAKPEDVRAILREVDIPPIKLAREENAPQTLETLLPFAAKALADYRADYTTLAEVKENPQKYPLRMAVLQAVELMRDKFNPRNSAMMLREYFSGTSNEKIKAEILQEQRKPADVMSDLMDAKRDLEKAGEERELESSKRWQAHYDYVLAQLLARIAYLEEYSLALGRIRKDALEPLANGQSGYRLASRTKLQGGKEFKDMAAKSQKMLEKLAKKYKGTPWEVLAKRAQLTTLGLEWQPTR